MIDFRCFLLLELLLSVVCVIGCSNTGDIQDSRAFENSIPSFICTDNVEECDCWACCIFLAQASLGISPLEQLVDVEDISTVKSLLQKKAVANGGELTNVSIDDAVQRIKQTGNKNKHQLYILVHSNGHLYGLLGAISIDGVNMFQVFHGSSGLWLVSEQQLEKSGIAEVWNLSKNKETFTLSVGDGLLALDNVFINLGEVVSFQELFCTFRFCNVGSKNLILNKPTTSCTCTTIDMESAKKLLPLESFDLNLAISTGKNVIGRQNIMIECFEEGTGKQIRFPLEVFCAQRESIEISPLVLNLRSGENGESATASIFLHEVSMDRFEINSVEMDIGQDFSYSIQSTQNVSQLMTYQITISCNLTKIMPGTDGIIRINTTSSLTPVITIPVYTFIEPDLQIIPASLSFGVTDVGKTYKKKFTVKNQDKLPSIINMRVPEFVSCTHLVIDTSYEFEVEFSPHASGIWEDNIILVVSANGRNEEISIKIVAYIR
jgi:hypothetical protein